MALYRCSSTTALFISRYCATASAISAGVNSTPTVVSSCSGEGGEGERGGGLTDTTLLIERIFIDVTFYALDIFHRSLDLDVRLDAAVSDCGCNIRSLPAERAGVLCRCDERC